MKAGHWIAYAVLAILAGGSAYRWHEETKVAQDIRGKLQDASETIGMLQTEVADLRKSNARLAGRNEVLEKLEERQDKKSERLARSAERAKLRAGAAQRQLAQEREKHRLALARLNRSPHRPQQLRVASAPSRSCR